METRARVDKTKIVYESYYAVKNFEKKFNTYIKYSAKLTQEDKKDLEKIVKYLGKVEKFLIQDLIEKITRSVNSFRNRDYIMEEDLHSAFSGIASAYKLLNSSEQFMDFAKKYDKKYNDLDVASFLDYSVFDEYNY